MLVFSCYYKLLKGVPVREGGLGRSAGWCFFVCIIFLNCYFFAWYEFFQRPLASSCHFPCYDQIHYDRGEFRELFHCNGCTGYSEMEWILDLIDIMMMKLLCITFNFMSTMLFKNPCQKMQKAKDALSMI